MREPTELKNFVAGEHSATRDGARSPVIDPCTGDIIATAPLTGVLQDDDIVQQEVFGPVVTVQPFANEDQAVAWANGVEYGLGASVWTSNHSRAMRMARRLDFGVVWINTHVPSAAEMPHGSFKSSGYGEDLSMYGFEDYTRIKHVMSYIGT